MPILRERFYVRMVGRNIGVIFATVVFSCPTSRAQLEWPIQIHAELLFTRVADHVQLIDDGVSLVRREMIRYSVEGTVGHGHEYYARLVLSTLVEVVDGCETDAFIGEKPVVALSSGVVSRIYFYSSKPPGNEPASPLTDAHGVYNVLILFSGKPPKEFEATVEYRGAIKRQRNGEVFAYSPFWEQRPKKPTADENVLEVTGRGRDSVFVLNAEPGIIEDRTENVFALNYGQVVVFLWRENGR